MDAGDSVRTPPLGADRSLVRDVLAWGRRLGSEIALLPDTLERLRLGAADFQKVGERLRATSEALEQITSLYSVTLSDTVRRSTEAADAMRAQIDRLPGSEAATQIVSAAVTEVQRTLRTVASMNPFLSQPDDRRR